MADTNFRVCSLSGLKIDRSSELLIRWNVIVGVLLLALGGLMGLLVGLTRWPSVHFLPLEYYYRFLTGHGLNALIAWIIFFEIALVHFASTVILGVRSYTMMGGIRAYH